MADPLRAIVELNEPIDASRQHLICVVTDNQTKAVQDVIVSSMEQLKSILRGTALQVQTSKELLSLQPGQEIDLSITPIDPPPDPIPTPEDIIVANFTASVNDWFNKTLLSTYELGDVADTQAAHTVMQTLLDDVKDPIVYQRCVNSFVSIVVRAHL